MRLRCELVHKDNFSTNKYINEFKIYPKYKTEQRIKSFRTIKLVRTMVN